MIENNETQQAKLRALTLVLLKLAMHTGKRFSQSADLCGMNACTQGASQIHEH
jgi:hypothetical protein